MEISWYNVIIVKASVEIDPYNRFEGGPFMKLDLFGGIEIDESELIIFEEGILGFEDNHKYILMNQKEVEEPIPFKWLQAIDDETVGFVVAYPYLLLEEYDFELDDDIVRELEIENSEEIVIYNIVTVGKNFAGSTVNLKAPLVINSRTRKGKQVVLADDRWPLKYAFVAEMKKRLEEEKK